MSILLPLGGVAAAEDRPDSAAGISLAFRGFLRTGGLLACCFGHISVRGHDIVAALPLTKIGARRGQQEVVTFKCPLTRLFLLRAAHIFLPGDTVLGCGSTAFRSWWTLCLRKIQINPDVLRPYALRRGGAAWKLQ